MLFFGKLNCSGFRVFFSGIIVLGYMVQFRCCQQYQDGDNGGCYVNLYKYVIIDFQGYQWVSYVVWYSYQVGDIVVDDVSVCCCQELVVYDEVYQMLWN